MCKFISDVDLCGEAVFEFVISCNGLEGDINGRFPNCVAQVGCICPPEDQWKHLLKTETIEVIFFI